LVKKPRLDNVAADELALRFVLILEQPVGPPSRAKCLGGFLPL
jgi:hypothetical protein